MFAQIFILDICEMIRDNKYNVVYLSDVRNMCQ